MDYIAEIQEEIVKDEIRKEGIKDHGVGGCSDIECLRVVAQAAKSAKTKVYR